MAKYDLSYPKAYRLVKVLKARSVTRQNMHWVFYFKKQSDHDYAKALLFMYSIPHEILTLSLRGVDSIGVLTSIDMEDCPIDVLIN